MARKQVNSKSSFEFGQRIWILQTKEGKVIDRFSTKAYAEDYKKWYENQYYYQKDTLEVVKDKDLIEKLKKEIKK